MKKNIIVLVVFIITTLALSLVIVLRENELEKLNEQVEMQELNYEMESKKFNTRVEMMELYYELKLDYYEELYGFDLDDTPEDFVKFLYDNYRELYDYLMEVDNANGNW